MRILIAGSRDIDEYDQNNFYNLLVREIEDTDTIVSGGARGVDTLAETFAYDYSIPFELFPANWDKHGRSAGYKRNAEMVASGIDKAYILWDGTSKGTQHTIGLLTQRDIPYLLVNLGDNK